MPVLGSKIWDPKIKLIVDVSETAMPFLSTTELWLCEQVNKKAQLRNWILPQFRDLPIHHTPVYNIQEGGFDPIPKKKMSKIILENNSYTHIRDIP